jgi:predicted translation initiation factor SUI1
MAKSQRVILFVAQDAARAKAAETAFSGAASRLGLSWSVRSRTPETLTSELFAEVSVLVVVDSPEFTPDWQGKLERIGAELDLEVNKLLARLLGGNDQAVASPPPPPPAAPKKVYTVKVSRETAGRKGKGVTVVSELPLGEDALKELATKLKNACGSGGTAKDGRIEIQGEHRDKLVAELEKLGYKVKRAGG